MLTFYLNSYIIRVEYLKEVNLVPLLFFIFIYHSFYSIQDAIKLIKFIKNGPIRLVVIKILEVIFGINIIDQSVQFNSKIIRKL